MTILELVRYSDSLEIDDAMKKKKKIENKRKECIYLCLCRPV